MTGSQSITIGFATTNPHKLQETQQCLDRLCPGIQLVSVPPENEVEETGKTFAENARIKLDAILQESFSPEIDYIITEDAGLSVNFLNGLYGLDLFPGVHSARWFNSPEAQTQILGHPLDKKPTYEDINQAILLLLGHNTERDAAYHAHVCCWNPQTGKMIDVEGTVALTVAYEARGTNGFGYDPIMIPAQFDPTRTMAELSSEEKNRISHRYHALKQLLAALALPSAC